MDEPRPQSPQHTASESDWDPVGLDVRRDQRAAYDAMRERCPVAHGGPSHWTVFRHADVVRVVTDHATFSNVVSRHPSAPNGMDPPEHTAYRHVVEAYFSAARVAAFEPACRQIASRLVDAACRRPASAPSPAQVEVMHDLALPFAAQVQCAYFGWPLDLSTRLIEWAHRNHDATLARSRRPSGPSRFCRSWLVTCSITARHLTTSITSAGAARLPRMCRLSSWRSFFRQIQFSEKLRHRTGP